MKRCNKVLLAAVNAKYIHSNLAVYCLRAYSRPYRDQAEIAEYTINQQTDQILRDIYRRKPDFAAFSCYIWNIDLVEQIVTEVHKILPDTVLWLGGPEVSFDARERLEKLPFVTGVMKGEGEATFLELMDYYVGGKGSLQEIQGITYRTEEGICSNPWREPIPLNSIPFPYGEESDLEHRIVYYETSRGCPFRCSYCLSSIDKTVRLRDMELVRQELQFFLDRNVPQVKFIDRTFNCSRPHTREIWTYLLEHDNGITNFHFEITADLLNEEELRLLNRMRKGLVQLEIGVQSTNRQTIEAIRRKMDLERLFQVTARVREGQNVHQHLDLIAGLPHEDLASFRRSFDELYLQRPDQLQLGFLKVLKGSYMYENREAYGLVCQDRPPYEVLYTNWLSYGDILELKQVEEMVEIYYNSRQFEQTLAFLEHEWKSSFDFYRDLGRYYEEKGLDLLSHSRMRRYEILFEHLQEKMPEKTELIRELLVYDLYARENSKSRPPFARDQGQYKEKTREFYHNPDNIVCYLKQYEGYESRQTARMTHLEFFRYDLRAAAETGEVRERNCAVLFDYKERDPLHHQARIADVTDAV